MEAITAVGRPRVPLLVGQRIYAQSAYPIHIRTQLDLASRIGASLPRVRRFLVDTGLHVPIRHHSSDYSSAVNQAVRMYIEGIPVAELIEESGVVVSELYKALRRRGVPLRTAKIKKSLAYY